MQLGRHDHSFNERQWWKGTLLMGQFLKIPPICYAYAAVIGASLKLSCDYQAGRLGFKFS